MMNRKALVVALIACLTALSACTVSPLYGETATAGIVKNVAVAEVDSRAGQQVRNRLLFLLNGSGAQAANPEYEARLAITSRATGILSVSTADGSDVSARRVGVTGTLTLIDVATGETRNRFSRTKYASYDTSAQSASNQRALLEAENRAAVDLAEEFRTLIVSSIKQ